MVRWRFRSVKRVLTPFLSLVLYARDGDTILTADTIRDRIELADVEKRIQIPQCPKLKGE